MWLGLFFLGWYFFLAFQTTYFSEHLSLLRQTKKFTQPKRIYSANGNPFIPMIYRFYAPLLFPDLCATLITNITLFFGNLSPWEGNKRSVFLAGVHLILLCFIRISLLSAETFFSFNKNLFPMHFNLSDRGDFFFFY